MATYTWQTAEIALDFTWDDDSPVCVTDIRKAADEARSADAPTPLVQVNVVGEGRIHNISRALDRTECGARMRYVTHEETSDGDRAILTLTQRDEVTGLRATTTFATRGGAAASIELELANDGTGTAHVDSMPLNLSGVLRGGESATDVEIHRGRSAWSSENRWDAQPVMGSTTLVVNDDTSFLDMPPTSTIPAVGRSTWTTDGDLPVGALVNKEDNRAVAWEVMAAGAPWKWELFLTQNTPAAYALGLSGPTNEDHAWVAELAPGASTRSPMYNIAVSADGLDGVIGELTRIRRAIRFDGVVEQSPSLIFNDYMNTLMGDPTAEKLIPLIDAVAEVGVETFCIDCGWYDESGDWWPTVGEWMPSESRFGDLGLQGVLDYIRSKGMKPGLWVEPEVIGVNSPMMDRLPDDAFIRRNGVKVTERERHLLDMRSPAARKHLDETFDRLITEYGAGMFKLDYNVTPGLGTDVDAPSTGAGLVAHRDAYLGWFRDLRARHPHVVFENCSSGAMRQDFGQVANFDLQSTSDQQSHLLYPVIATGAPMQMPQELAGNWAYPNSTMDEEQFAIALMNGLAGRMYLSGYINRMAPGQVDMIREASRYYLDRRDHLVTSTPCWPLGLPAWDAPQVVLGMRTDDLLRLFVWNRSAEPARLEIPVPAGATARDATVAFPAKMGGAAWSVSASGATVVADIPAGPTGRIIEVPLVRE